MQIGATLRKKGFILFEVPSLGKSSHDLEAYSCGFQPLIEVESEQALGAASHIQH